MVTPTPVTPFQLWRYPERSWKFLKDPHCGAFAVIRLCSYFVAYLRCAAACSLRRRWALCGCWRWCWSVHSGLRSGGLSLAKNTGLAHTFATAADRTTVRRVLGAGDSCLLAVALFGWAVGVLGAGGGGGCFCGATTVWRSSSLAVLPEIWPGGFCKRLNYMLAALVFCQWKGFL